MAYNMHLFEYWMICSAGKSNLEANIVTIRKLKNFPSNDLNYSVEQMNNDSVQIFISNTKPISAIDLESIKRIYLDSLNSSYSLSPKGTILLAKGDSVLEIKKWYVRFDGESDSAGVLSAFFNANFKTINSALHASNCKYIVGKRDDLTLTFNKSIYMQYGCIVDNWYFYHYHIGIKEKLDSRKIKYHEFENGIQYGWW